VPTAATNTYTDAGLAPMYSPEEAFQFHVKLPNSTTLVKGTVLGELTATPGSFKAYASGNADGSQTPKAILTYDVTVDGSGNHTLGGGDQGVTSLTAPAYFSGYFKTSELTGLDATALTNSPAWKLINGSVADGVLRIG
jgi:hypothetical protein